MAGSTWQNSGLSFDDPTGSVEHEETSRLDSIGRDPMSIGWTDEMHSLYLTSMEASFVEQLYSSKDLSGWHPGREQGFDRRSRRQGKLHLSGKVKVDHNGHTQKKYFYRPDPQPEADGCHNFANLWVNRFAGRGKPDMAPSTSQGSGASMNQSLSCGGELSYLSGSGNISRHSKDGEYDEVSNCNEEVSDQNFVE